jgi:hypothetical protein
MGIGAAAGAIGYGAGMVASKVIGKYAAGLGGKMLSKLGALTSREAQPAESSMAAFFGRMDAACAQRSFVQTTLDQFGLQFEESATSAFFRSMDAMVKSESVYQTAYVRSILQIGPEWKFAGRVLAGAAAERVGEMLFERIGTYVSQRSASMPTFG